MENPLNLEAVKPIVMENSTILAAHTLSEVKLPQQLKLMVIDDKDIAHFIMKKFVAFHLPSNTTVKCFSNISDSLEELKTAEPDFIFLDLCLPNIDDGFSFLEQLKDMNSQQKVIILTADNDNNKRSICMSYPNVIDYITKPLSGPELYRAIKVKRD